MENGNNERITFTEYETSLAWILYIDNDPSADKDAIDRQKPIQRTYFITNYEERFSTTVINNPAYLNW